MLSVLMMGCGAAPSAPVDVEVLDFDLDHDEWRLVPSTLTTVTDLDHLTGTLFDLVGAQVLAVDNLALQKLEPADVDTDQLRANVVDRPGVPVRLSYSWQAEGGGRRAVTNDYESLAMLTVFHHVEQAWLFFRDVVGDASAATREPCPIGFYATVGAKLGIAIPQLAADNAAFMPLSDSFVILRTSLLQGVPLALNRGVITHEFSHRVLHHNVFDGAAFSSWVEHQVIDPPSSAITNPSEEQLADFRTHVLLRGFDEGCADIHAVAFSGRPDFISDSVGGPLGEPTRLQRDLEGAFAEWADYTTLKEEYGNPPEVGQDLCSGKSKDFTSLTWQPYCIGTVWAKTLWEAAGRSGEALGADLLPALNRALRRLGEEHLAVRWHFDFDLIMELLAQELVGEPLLIPLCENFALRFAELGPVPTCR